VLFDVIVTVQIEALPHAFNVSLRKERQNVSLKAGRFLHSASRVLDYADVTVSVVNLELPASYRQGIAPHFKTEPRNLG
jgi:hypothetical protein